MDGFAREKNFAFCSSEKMKLPVFVLTIRYRIRVSIYLYFINQVFETLNREEMI